jgi:hypothetical protein
MTTTTATRAADARARATTPCALPRGQRNGWQMIVLVGQHLRLCGVSRRTIDEFTARALQQADDFPAVVAIAREYTDLARA